MLPILYGVTFDVEITVNDDLLGVLGSKVYQLTTTYDPTRRKWRPANEENMQPEQISVMI